VIRIKEVEFYVHAAFQLASARMENPSVDKKILRTYSNSSEVDTLQSSQRDGMRLFQTNKASNQETGTEGTVQPWGN